MVRFATVVKKSVFDSAHSNTGFGEGHKCSRIHGHTFNYEVHVRSQVNDSTGLSIDFGIVKEAMKESVDKVLDHYYLNLDVPHFQSAPPSAENIAFFIFNEVQCYLDEEFYNVNEIPFRAEVTQVVLHETPTSSIIITKNDFDDWDSTSFRAEVSG